MDTELSTNSIALIALCNEYCRTVERARAAGRDGFTEAMLRLLPRIYIAASDMQVPPGAEEAEPYIEPALDEEQYDAIRRDVEAAMGPDDVFLEVFEEDMKYSDTPIAASVSESVADIYQALYNFIETIKDAPSQLVQEALTALRDSFAEYWSQTLCNLMRPLNHIRHNNA